MNEDIRKGFQEAGDILTNKYRYANYHAGTYDLISRYRMEVGRWYTEGDTHDQNPLSTTTQEHWYSLFLERKRLDSRRIKVFYRNFIGTMSPRSARESMRTDDATYMYHTQGRFLTCRMSETTKLERVFVRDNAPIYQQNLTKRMDYYVISSKTPNETYICPNCATVLDSNRLIDGCDFCGTKFSVGAFEDKVSGFYSNLELFSSRETDSGSLFRIIPPAILIGLGIILPFYPFFLIIFKVLFLLIGIGIAVIEQIRSNKKGPASSSLVKRRISEVNPYYSNEEFLSSLDCKMKAFCYADSYSEIEPFFEKDPEIRPMFRSVLLCESGAYRMKEFRYDDQHQYLTLTLDLNMVCEANGKIGPVKKTVKINMRTVRNPKIKHAVTTYACSNCGGTISLVEGGRCKYCGTKMNLENYDWIITDMELVDKL